MTLSEEGLQPTKVWLVSEVGESFGGYTFEVYGVYGSAVKADTAARDYCARLCIEGINAILSLSGEGPLLTFDADSEDWVDTDGDAWSVWIVVEEHEVSR